MEVLRRRERPQTTRSKARWIAIVNDWNTGMTEDEILDKYRKPDGSKYSKRSYLNWVFKRVKTL